MIRECVSREDHKELYEVFIERSGIVIDNGFSEREADIEAAKIVGRENDVYVKMVYNPAFKVEFYKKSLDNVEEKETIAGRKSKTKTVRLAKPNSHQLVKYIENGWSLYACYDNKALCKLSAIGTVEELQRCINGEIVKAKDGRGLAIGLFRFDPISRGFICLDIDIKTDKHLNGVENIQKWIRNKELSGLVKLFSNLDQFPCYTRTKSGGYHLYFKANRISPEKLNQITNSELIPGVEVKVRGLTAAGSDIFREGAYTMHGEFENAPLFPVSLLPYCKLKIRSEQSLKQNKNNALHSIKNTKKKKYSLSRCLDFVMRDNGLTPNDRHDICFHLARRAKKEGYTSDEIIRFLREMPMMRGHDGIETTVNSVFR